MQSTMYPIGSWSGRVPLSGSYRLSPKVLLARLSAPTNNADAARYLGLTLWVQVQEEEESRFVGL